MALDPEIEAKLIELGRAPGEGDGCQLEVELSYEGGVPVDFPKRVTLTAPPATEVWKICAHVKAEDNELLFLFYCLPPELRDCVWFWALAENCKRELVIQAMELVLGERLAHYYIAIGRRLNEQRARERETQRKVTAYGSEN